MAEGYSYNPDSHDDEETPLPKVELFGKGGLVNRLLRRGRSEDEQMNEPPRFLDVLRSHEKDDDDEEKKGKRARFWRLRKLLGGPFARTVDHQPVEGGEVVRREKLNVFGIEADYQPTTEQSEQTAPEAVEGRAVADAGTEKSEEVTEVTEAPIATEVEPPVTEEAPDVAPIIEADVDPVLEHPESTLDHLEPIRTTEVPETGTTVTTEPERVSRVVERWNRGRAVYIREEPRPILDFERRKVEHKVDKVTKEVKELEKTPIIPAVVFERAKPTPEVKKVTNTPEATKPRIEAIKEVIKKEQLQTKEQIKETTKEQIIIEQKSSKEAQISKEAQKWEQTVEHERELQREKIFVEAREAATNLEADETKELAREMSHEHKDLDRQTAGAWTVMQAKAEATAKANAAAIAKVQQDLAVSQQQMQTAVKNDQKPAKEPKSVYKTAIITGMATAIVVIAAILVILLIQSK